MRLAFWLDKSYFMDGGAVPRGYGVAYPDTMRLRYRLVLWPFHVPVGLFWKFWWWLTDWLVLPGSQIETLLNEEREACAQMVEQAMFLLEDHRPEMDELVKYIRHHRRRWTWGR